jgi:uncharacterized protein (TIGR03643 family)
MSTDSSKDNTKYAFGTGFIGLLKLILNGTLGCLCLPDMFTPEEQNRIIEMAWEDRTPFDAIFAQFGLKEQEVKEHMRAWLKPQGYRMWRRRVNGRATKHAGLRNPDVKRFRAPGQR